jgi:hypothetical protein
MKETTPCKRTASRIGYWREQVEQQEGSGLSVKQYWERHCRAIFFTCGGNDCAKSRRYDSRWSRQAAQKEQRMMSAWKLFFAPASVSRSGGLLIWFYSEE